MPFLNSSNTDEDDFIKVYYSRILLSLILAEKKDLKDSQIQTIQNFMDDSFFYPYMLDFHGTR
jgi:hypothetical protein